MGICFNKPEIENKSVNIFNFRDVNNINNKNTSMIVEINNVRINKGKSLETFLSDPNRKMSHNSKLNTLKQTSPMSKPNLEFNDSENTSKDNSYIINLASSKLPSHFANNFPSDDLDINMRELDNKEQAFIKSALGQHFLFRDLDQESFELFLNHLISYSINKSEVLFYENDDGNFFYIVKSGKFDLLIQNEYKKSFFGGDCFGDLALLQTQKRSGTVTCSEDAHIFVLEASIYRKTVQKLNNIRLKNRYFLLDQIPLFSKKNFNLF